MNDRMERDITEALTQAESAWPASDDPQTMLKEIEALTLSACRKVHDLAMENIDLQIENDGLRWRVWAVGLLGLVVGAAIGAAVMAAFSVRG